MDDFISREDTIEKMEEVDWYHQNKNGEMVHGANSSEHQAWYKAEDVYKVLEDMPSARPEQWIPCSETIDIPDHEVLCCDEYGEELIGWLSYSDDQWHCESDGEMMYDPIAWREKPEPWRGEE